MEIIAVCLTDASSFYSKRYIESSLNLADVKFNPHLNRYSGKTPETNLFFEYDPNTEGNGIFCYYVSKDTLQERLPSFLKGLKNILPKIIPHYKGIGLIKKDNSIEISSNDKQLEEIVMSILYQQGMYQQIK